MCRVFISHKIPNMFTEATYTLLIATSIQSTPSHVITHKRYFNIFLYLNLSLPSGFPNNILWQNYIL
jgi:hypothetical protein